MKLKFNAIQILVSELLPDEMGVIYMMGLQKEVPATVNTAVFTNIITFLCRKLDWIETDKEKVEPATGMTIGNKECSDKILVNTEQQLSDIVSDPNTKETIKEGQFENGGPDSITSSFDDEETPKKSNSQDKETENIGTKTVIENSNENTKIQTKEAATDNVVCSNFKVVIENDNDENSSSGSRKLSGVDENISQPLNSTDKGTDEPKQSVSESCETKKAVIAPDLDMSCFDENEKDDSFSGAKKTLTLSNTEENTSETLGKVECGKLDSEFNHSCQTISFTCKECGKTFSKESYLSAHVFMKHEIKKEPSLSPYSKQVNQTYVKQFSCSTCKQKFAFKSSLRRHKIIHTDKAINCSQCDKKFSNRTDFKRHEETHTRLSTSTLDKTSSLEKKSVGLTEKEEKRRLWALENIQSGRYSCSQCPLKCRDSTDLRKHEARHAKGSTRFRWYTTTESHNKGTTKTYPPLEIKAEKDYEGENIIDSSLERRKENNLTEEEKERQRHSCSQCTRKFRDAADLKKHEERHDKGSNKLKWFAFTQDENYVNLDPKERKRIREREVRRKVIQSGIFSCSHCNKKFGKSSELKRHKETHLKGTTQEVSQEELEKRRLKARQKRREVLESGSFSCCHCGKRFRENRELDRHEKLHTGERPFMCCICGKAFIDAPRLKRHEIKHINDKQELATQNKNTENTLNC